MLLMPAKDHPEQASNALSLKIMGAAHVMHDLDPRKLKEFLECEDSMQVKYPNVARPLAEWIMKGNFSKGSANELCDTLWDQVETTVGTITPA